MVIQLVPATLANQINRNYKLKTDTCYIFLYVPLTKLIHFMTVNALKLRVLWWRNKSVSKLKAVNEYMQVKFSY